MEIISVTINSRDINPEAETHGSTCIKGEWDRKNGRVNPDSVRRYFCPEGGKFEVYRFPNIDHLFQAVRYLEKKMREILAVNRSWK